jgi:gas vesicle protein
MEKYMTDSNETSLLADAGKLLIGALLGATVLGVASYFIANQTSDELTDAEDAFDDESLNGEDS